jgi:hypothetical protein
MGRFVEKTRGKKSRATAPLNWARNPCQNSNVNYCDKKETVETS